MTNFSSARLTNLNARKVFITLLIVWLVANLIQAFFMEILSDEAYYGLYGKYLDWGYYDHPPMVALLIRISSLIFKGNLGIRFMIVLLQVGTILLTWKILNIKNPDVLVIITFFIITGSISLFAAYGVIATPDAPLLFFTALFLFSYKKFLADPKWTIALLLSLSMAGLIYSKYQAVLVIGFVILSDLKLLRSFKFWTAGVLAIILLLPHIRWQFANHFPSLQYHLVDRSEEFRWIYLLEYLPNQMAVFNPFILWAIGWVLLKYKPANQFNRSLYFLIIGFIGFFWLTALRGHVEPHWTIACSIPIILLITEKSRDDARLLHYIKRYVLPSISLLIIIRVFLMVDSRFNRYLGYSGKEEKYKAIESVAGDLPVIFTGSFQKPSLYPFFTGKNATVISSLYSRQTQFDLWQFEKKYNNKPAFICVAAEGRSNVYGTGRLKFSGFKTDSLQTVCRMKMQYEFDEQTLQPGDSVKIPFTVQNTYDYDINFMNKVFPVEICLVLLKGEEVYLLPVSLSVPVTNISSGAIIERELSALIPGLPHGSYHLGISLNTLFGPSLNSNFTKIFIKDVD
jgi:hypothetical protein